MRHCAMLRLPPLHRRRMDVDQSDDDAACRELETMLLMRDVPHVST